ncbi:Evolutionarily conserved signaling intermediate in Toll pathway, mitochondrial [Frankliniella fusca]|uniref:Evolutionarily conserved signaling intermediate in Toll pathway, mitochondrial n=1 Tax=Frankliniella fusca TaxID=407009 RepID=A0AAE1GRQ4_9NEOP|nr:Evolutionarily conserved signaling intermediate in Toll pathway, mitochondrial [Frankliniella fusca]
MLGTSKKMRHIAVLLLRRHIQQNFGTNFCSSRKLVFWKTYLCFSPTSRMVQTCALRYNSRSSYDADEEDDEKKEEMRKEAIQSALSTQTYFNSKHRNKETFEVMLEVFEKANPTKRGLVEFIFAARKHLVEYGVQYDLDIYKKLIKLLPEGKYVAQNVWQAEFSHYPKQQDCIVRLLDDMEKLGLCADKQMIDLLIKRFGRHSDPVRKCSRQIYWVPKFRNANPWPVPFPPITDPFLIAKLAIERICTPDPQSVVSVWQSKSVPEALDETYIVSGQSPTQQELLAKLPKNESIFVEGPLNLWFGKARINYFMLRADTPRRPTQLQDPDDVSNLKNPFLFESSDIVEVPSVHEQEDGTILAVCATGTSSRDSILSWIRLLEIHGNPALSEIPVTFSLKSPKGDVTPVDKDGPVTGDESEKLGDK